MDLNKPEDIQRYNFTAAHDDFRVVFQKMLIVAGLPFICVLVPVLVWAIILRAKQQTNQLETMVISTIVILTFLVHPTITEVRALLSVQYMVDMFDCHTYDGDLRFQLDLQVLCYQGLHNLLAFAVSLPCLVLYGLGIPMVVWILMRKETERFDTKAAKQKFGFLYNGYKRKNYYWEIIIMYRKTLCIFVSVFMNRIGVIVQALVMLIILVCFMQVHSMRRPFIARTLNDMEDLSLMTSVVTIYCGLFFISSKDENSSDFVPDSDFSLNETGQLILFLVIVCANFFFILYWVVKYIMLMRLRLKEKFKRVYICLFLCCRQDKYEKETEQLAQEQKRETIIEKIEEIQFYLKEMKRMYTKEIFYEGHQRFMKLMYFVEFEKNQIDLTEKKHNFYVQGKMARDRKFDPERMKEILDQNIIEIDQEFGGTKGRPIVSGVNESSNQRLLKKRTQEERAPTVIEKARMRDQKKCQSEFGSSFGEESILESSSAAFSLKKQGSRKKTNKVFNEESNEESKDQIIREHDFEEASFDTSRLNDTRRLMLLGKGSVDQEKQDSSAFRLKPMATKYLIEEEPEDEEKKKKDKWEKNAHLEERIQRSRNPTQNLRKKAKERQFMSGKDLAGKFQDQSQDSESKKESAQSLQPSTQGLKTPQDTFFRDDIKHVAEEDFVDDESLEQLRNMRQLTRRWQGKGDAKRKNSSKTSNLPQLDDKDHKLSSQNSNSQSKREMVSEAKKKEVRERKLGKLLMPSIVEEEISPSLKPRKSKSNKFMTKLEVMEYLKLNKDKLKLMPPIQLEQRLRPPSVIQRHLLVDNFCQKPLRIQESVGQNCRLSSVAMTKKMRRRLKHFQEFNEGELPVLLDEIVEPSRELRHQKTMRKNYKKQRKAAGKGSSGSFGSDTSFEEEQKIFAEELCRKLQEEEDGEEESDSSEEEEEAEEDHSDLIQKRVEGSLTNPQDNGLQSHQQSNSAEEEEKKESVEVQNDGIDSVKLEIRDFGARITSEEESKNKEDSSDKTGQHSLFRKINYESDNSKIINE